ncbi:MAG TPA: hypothetical protein VGK67_28485 [Myxococcales bacterium]|jgi:hypothetical protein
MSEPSSPAPREPAATTGTPAPPAAPAPAAGSTPGSPPRRRLRWIVPVVLVPSLCALAALLVWVRSADEGLWDWDTYGRLLFLYHYQPELWLDGHVLYHYLVRAFMQVGIAPITGIFWITAGSAAALVGVAFWICRREGLSKAATALVLLAATLGSPGLVSLFLLTEDNLLYAPMLLAFYYLQALEPSDERRRSVVSGLLLAAGILTNVSLLVLLFAAAAAPFLWKTQRRRALGVLLGAGTAVVAYHLAHLFPFTGAKNAMHEFLPQALRLRDFRLSDAPLFSLARVDQYLGGLRAMALTPSVHLMALPPLWRVALLSWLPKLLAALYLALAALLLSRAGLAATVSTLKRRLDLVALFGITAVFPYLYEPALIERWDLFWLALLLGLVLLLKARPPRPVVGLLVAAVAIQTAGGGLAIAHHFGKVFAEPGFTQMRAFARDVRQRGSDPLVLPFSVDRLLLADLTFRAPGRAIYLVRDAGDKLECFRLFDLMEQPAPLSELQARVRASRDVFVHPSLSRHSVELLGLESGPAAPR